MAVTWGAWSNHLRAGIEVTVSGSTATVRYFLAFDGWDFADPETLVRTGAITGNSEFTNNLNGSHVHQVQDGFMELPSRTRSVSPGQDYTFAARIANVYDGSEPTVTFTYTAPIDTPNAPTGLNASAITSGGATMKWTQPSDWGGNDTDDYQIQYSKSSSFSSATSITVNNATQYVLSTLDNNTLYYVRVRAKNSAGYGSWSSVVSFSTLAGGPSVPLNPSVSNIGPTSAIGHWTAPTDNGGSPIVRYETQVADNPEFEDALNSGTVDARTAAPLSGLEPKTHYYFRVRGLNATGAGPWSTNDVQFDTLAGAKVMKGGVFVDVPTYVQVGGVRVAVAPQKRVGGAWVY